LLGAERMLHAARLVKKRRELRRVGGGGFRDEGRYLSAARAGQARRVRNLAEQTARPILCCGLHADVLSELQLEETRSPAPFGMTFVYWSRFVARSFRSRARKQRSASRLTCIFCERSARAFAAALDASGVPAVPVTSAEFVLTCDTFRDAKPQMEETRRAGAPFCSRCRSGLVPW